MDWFSTTESVYQATSLILSIGLLIGAVEDISTLALFRSSGLLSWKVTRFIIPFTSLFKIADFLFGEVWFGFCVYLRFFVSLVFFVCSLFLYVSPTITWALFFLNFLFMFRSPYGLDGACQMNLMILLGMSLGLTFKPHSLYCVLFIAGQLICAYFVSGVTKLASSFWRNGNALKMVFGTSVYGHPLIYKLAIQLPLFSLMASWATMLFESLFPLVLLANTGVVIVFVGMGILFHLSNSIFMGLNGFLFAFLAAYPSLFFLLGKLRYGVW